MSLEAIAQKYLVDTDEAGAYTQLAGGLSRQFFGPAKALAVDLVAVNTLAEKSLGILQNDFKLWFAVHVSH